MNLSAEIEVPTVAVAASSVEFGRTALGEVLLRSLSVVNPNEATPIQVTGVIPPTTGDFTLPLPKFPITVAPGRSIAMTAQYAPEALGFALRTVVIQTSVGTDLGVSLTGTGIKGEQVTDHGFIPVDGTGQTPWIEIDAPPEAISIHVEIFADHPSGDFYLNGFEGPGGKVYENDTFTGPYDWFGKQFDQFGFPLYFDLIEDTANCFGESFPINCPTLGDDNLMWPYDLGFVDGLLLTRGQTNVMLNHPLVEPGPPPTISMLAGFPPLAAVEPRPELVGRRRCANCAGLYPRRPRR